MYRHTLSLHDSLPISCFGLLGGIGAHPDDVMHLKRTADRLFGDNYHWSVLAAGANQLRGAAMAASKGGHVRVGLEDSLWIGAGQPASSHARSEERRVGKACGRTGNSRGAPYRKK